jgi:hypothetical protein
MGFMVKLRKALVVLPGDVPDEIALVPNSHGYAIYLGESRAGSLTFVRAGLGVPRALQDQGRGGAGLPNSPRTGEQHDNEELRKYCRGAGAARRGTDLIDHPSARVAVSESSGQLGVQVWKPLAKHPVSKPPVTPGEAAKARAVTKLEGQVDEAFRQTFDQVLAETFLGAIWPAPAPSTGTLQDYDTLCQAAEYLLAPETLLLKGINAAARAAAHAATFGPLAPLVGKLAENFCAPLLRPSAERQTSANLVKIIDIDLYADDGRLAECTTLRELTVEQVANVIDNSLKSPPGTPIDRESLVSQPRGPGGWALSEPSPPSRTEPPQPGSLDDRRERHPPQGERRDWSGPPANSPRRKPRHPPQPPGRGQIRPSPGSEDDKKIGLRVRPAFVQTCLKPCQRSVEPGVLQERSETFVSAGVMGPAGARLAASSPARPVLLTRDHPVYADHPQITLNELAAMIAGHPRNRG